MHRLAFPWWVAAAGLFGCATASHHASYTDPTPTCRTGAGPTGSLRITARILPDGDLARNPIADIDSVGCHGTGYAAGVILFPAVPAGTYRVHVRNWGSRVDTTMTIQPGRETRLSAVLPVFDALRRVCGPVAFCDALMPEPIRGPTMTPSDSLRAAAVRTALVLMRFESGIPDSIPLCLSLSLRRDVDPSASLLRNLQLRRGGLLPASACVVAEGEPHYVERVTGRSAVRLHVGGIQTGPDRHRTVTAGYYAGTLFSAEWSCEYAREGQGWRVVRCPSELVS